MKTPEQVARQSGQTVHIYYHEGSEQFEAFKLYSERKDNEAKDEPAEDEPADI